MKKNSIRVVVRLAVMLFVGTTSNPISAQLTLTGTHYTQTFDTISSGLPVGWSVLTNATATNVGIAALFSTNSTSWSATSGQFSNFASTTNNDGTAFAGSESSAIQSAATNRCAGVRLTTAFGDPGAAFVLQLQNTLGFADFELSLDFNLLSPQNRTNTWTVDYGIGANPANFIPVGTYTDPGAFSTTHKTFAFGGALDNQSQTVWIRVVALTASTGSGSRDTLGIDNFKLSYNSGISPVPLNIEMIGADPVLTWTNPAFVLQAAPAVTGPYTNVPGATSPYTNPVAGSQQYFRLKAN